MARRVERVGTDRAWYVPDIDSNREDPDPFRVEVSPMTAAEVQEIERDVASMRGGPKVDPMARAQAAVRRSFERHVHRVEGYEVTGGDGVIIRPATGADLYEAVLRYGDAAEAGVLDDIYAAVRDSSRLRAGLPEASSSPSVSSSAPASSPTPTSGAGAASAAGEKTDPPSGISRTPKGGYVVGAIAT